MIKTIFTTRIVPLLTVLVFTGGLVSAENPFKTIMTVDLQPYAFPDESGGVNGFSVNLLLRIFESMGVPVTGDDIRIVPWPRSYSTIQTDTTGLMFSVGRTPEREGLFQWVGPIDHIRFGVIGRADSTRTYEQMRDDSVSTIAVLRGAAPEQLLIEQGFPRERLYPVATARQGLRMLNSGRVQGWGAIDTSVAAMVRESGYDLSDFEVKWILLETDLYYIVNSGSDPAVVSEMNRHLRILKDEHPGEPSPYELLRRQYLGERAVPLAAELVDTHEATPQPDH